MFPSSLYDRPMAKSSTYNRTQFRLVRAEATWRELTEVVRAAAALPDYVGPDVGSFERIAEDIAALRLEVRSWGIDEALRRRPRPALRGPALRAIQEVLRR